VYNTEQKASWYINLLGNGLQRRGIDMTKIGEIDALRAVDDALSGLEDSGARNRVLAWAWDKFSSKPAPSTVADQEVAKDTLEGRKFQKEPSSAKGKAKSKAKGSLGMVKDLNLKPKDKTSLDEFIEKKKPTSYYEKCATLVYYLKNELCLPNVTENHVYSCFKHMKWRIPADLSNTLAYTASQYGWLDTSNLQDVKVTTMGENLVEHDLPKKKGSKKS
jgi:hypothetical protein